MATSKKLHSSPLRDFTFTVISLAESKSVSFTVLRKEWPILRSLVYGTSDKPPSVQELGMLFNLLDLNSEQRLQIIQPLIESYLALINHSDNLEICVWCRGQKRWNAALECSICRGRGYVRAAKQT